MFLSKRRIGLSVLTLGAALTAAGLAADSPATQPTSTTPRRTSNRLVRPWSQLSDLTPEERTQILQIHRKAQDAIRAIRDREHSDIEALLTDAQRGEAAKIEAERPARRSRRATTQPAGGEAT